MCLLCSGPENPKQEAIVEAFMHAWTAYKRYAWGHDELKPISRGWQEWMGVALTMVDSLDTMYIMGLKDGKKGRITITRSSAFKPPSLITFFTHGILDVLMI